MKVIGAIRKLRKVSPRHSLIIIYKSFVRPHFGYSDSFYDQPYNESLCQKIESIQHNGALTTTGAINGTCQIKLYNEEKVGFVLI